MSAADYMKDDNVSPGEALGKRCDRAGTHETPNAVSRLLAKADVLAGSDLEGIEDAARQLADLAAGDVAVVSRARRLAAARVKSDPSVHNKQVMALVRRALEVGMSGWSMEDSRPLL